MLVTNVFLKGHCREAIDTYVKAFDAKVVIVMPDSGNEKLIAHAEIMIHDQLLMLNDFGGFDDSSNSAGYQLALRYENVKDLKASYAVLEEGSTTIFPMQSTDYSPCVVRFIDKFDVRWALWI